jgi:hypothetical protein
MLPEKVDLRIRNLPKNAMVCDLFCGTGKIYERAYKGRVAGYVGVDHEKVHSPTLCKLGDNVAFVQETDLSQFNVLDLDDYGNPWKLMYLICRNKPAGEMTMFVTDGLIARTHVSEIVTKMISAIEKIPMGVKIPGLCRWYVDMFGTMLKDLERRYGWKTTRAQYFCNRKQRTSVYYWALKMRKVA